MTEPDRSSSTDETPKNEAEPDSGTHNDNNSNEGGEADQSGGRVSPNASSLPDQALNTNYDSSDGAIPIHRCERCDNYETLTHAALLTHLSRCTGAESETSPSTEPNNRKIFECDVCNMKFSNGANMRRHKMRHTGVKPYECRVCQKRFFRKDHLAEHFTTHNKTLPYHCPICNRGFQRQIAMRAHFQNEHVGQHDMIKSCPLCSYRAGSMKSLRVHFFNRHGIDLDNPGPGGPGLSLLPGGGHCSPLEMSCNMGIAATFSDSGDSLGARSLDNGTPPMHFLTPHVEISMSDAPPASYSPAPCGEQATQASSQSTTQSHMNGDSPDGSAHSGDSNSNTPSSSQLNSRMETSEMNNITPSISLIPIKLEPGTEEEAPHGTTSGPVNLSTGRTDTHFQSATSSSLTNLIKVSPLKSLLREDLKRKISSRSSAASRARLESANSPRPESSFSLQPTATTTNGIITSTGQEQPSDSTYRSNHKKSSLQCVFCGIGFPDQTLYFLHKGCHSDSNPWKCNICGEQCSNVYEFNSHLLSKTHQ